MTKFRTQRETSIIAQLKESIQKAYISDNSALLESLSTTILEIHAQNYTYIRQNQRLETESIKNENRTLLNLFSNLLVLQSRIYDKQRRGT